MQKNAAAAALTNCTARGSNFFEFSISSLLNKFNKFLAIGPDFFLSLKTTKAKKRK